MKHTKKQNEISILCAMASTVSDNLTNIESSLNKKTSKEHLYTDTLFFELLQITEKNYFTTIEREDIFLIACNIQNLNDEICILNETIETDFFLKAEKLKKPIKQLTELFKDCIKMLRELEKLPKSDGITQVYKNFRTDIAKINDTNDNIRFYTCKNYCRKIADSIYFSYLKNT